MHRFVRSVCWLLSSGVGWHVKDRLNLCLATPAQVRHMALMHLIGVDVLVCLFLTVLFIELWHFRGKHTTTCL